MNVALVQVTRRLQRSGRLSDRQVEAVGWAMMSWELIGPLAASLPEITVVGRARSPLWGYACFVTTHVAVLLVWVTWFVRGLHRSQPHTSMTR
ncbi:hypothetical protein [Modestobacter lapidis]|nr:hypothetical protein [Modestobacter lapidis]